MANRGSSRAADVVRATVKVIGEISSKRNPQKWLSHIQTVESGVVVEGFSKPKPAVFVTISLGPDTPGGMVGGTQQFVHDMSFTLSFLVITDLNASAYSPIDIESDIRLAMVEDEHLKDLLHEMLAFSNAEFDYEAMKILQGMSAMRIQYVGKFRWDHSKP